MYDVDLQKLYISVLLTDNDLFTKISPIIKPKYFDAQLQRAVKEIIEYSETYGSLPSPEYVNSKTNINIELPSKIDFSIEKWFMDEFPKFCLHKSMEHAVVESSELISSQDYDKIETLIKDAMSVHLEQDFGLDYAASPKQRLLNILSRNGNISSGFKALDSIVGCLNYGDLVIYAGGSGSGKSLFLQNNALSHYLNNMNVVYITLELHPELCSRRMDSMLLELSTNELYNNVDATEMAILSKLKNNVGSLMVKYMPSGTKTSQIKNFVKEYIMKKGIKPDVIAIDYLDLLTPVNKVSVGDQFNKDKNVSEELRNIFQEFNILGLTASQLNRTAVNNEDLDHSHIAGGISKINTADLVLGIITSNAMREKGAYELQILKSRNSKGTGRKVKLSYMTNCMKIKDDQDFLSNINTYMQSPINTSTTLSKEEELYNQVQEELNASNKDYQEQKEKQKIPEQISNGMGTSRIDKLRELLDSKDDDEDSEYD